MKKNNNKGFTLMEMLIVVAIIAVLVAIAIPTFSGSLQKAKEAADVANVRSYYAQAVTDYLTSTDATPQYADEYGGEDLNYEDNLSWEGGDTLTVSYDGEYCDLNLTNGGATVS